MIDIFATGSYSGIKAPTRACPASAFGKENELLIKLQNQIMKGIEVHRTILKLNIF